MKISCIIIDDEPNALKLLASYIEKAPTLFLMGQFFDALEAMEFLKGQQVDVIFTDINMPMISGLQLASCLPKRQKFIFTTAYAEYALDSFNYQVVDYLLKPIEFERFLEAVDKVTAPHGSHSDKTNRQGEREHIFVKSSGKLLKIYLADIRYIRGEREYVGLYMGESRHLVYKRMKEIELLLPDNFKRIHLSYIINTLHIQEISSGEVVIAGISLPIGSTYREAFNRYLNNLTI
ncbi:DNA-binding response regulator, LytR/AlgR family [Mucilaginibacter gossypiicola]|uniref:DNA-binding response regulator, LytR/AlgR family n=1 Tax=Mucilaginibacter gossypiicola TaxID=551995 RepID=A0A1H8D185_9SPHI|nr:response regulator transcription factor [Mucilaginibacter gossypiicola]SEN00976.1 DNA-binding response regulator, LytR/AlgR family [Mucilaginibacter gossypiicola]